MLSLLVVFVLWTLAQQMAVLKSEARNMLGPPFGFSFIDFGPAKGWYQIGGPKDALYFLFYGLWARFHPENCCYQIEGPKDGGAFL